jgi:formamidopyrimidine-DNA glycosylase
MPELPDIEVFTENLQNIFAGKIVKSVKIHGGNNVTDSQGSFTRRLKGKILKRIFRSVKEMRIGFSDGTLVGLHLMLTGDLYEKEKGKVSKSAIATINFKDDTGLVLTDRMKNAFIKLDPEDKAGIDALSKSLNFTSLKKLLQRKAKIKGVLTNQKIIRGLGNSYSDEILWQARISPNSIAKAIPEAKVKELAVIIKRVLKKEIKNIRKSQKGKIRGEVKDFLQIHTKDKTTSPTEYPIIIEKHGMMKTYFTKEQVLYQ